uniref:Uncharacterized protein n=1 Tax=Kalanchoe fedtschenkoi TaxID=63787 RepID=A0A7N0VEA6_KALFE
MTEDGVGGDHQHHDGDEVLDKSVVYNVKPMRSLVPMFSNPPNHSSSPNAPPFLSVSPAGPYPHGVVPFYPFAGPAEINQARTQNFRSPVQAAVPLNSFRTPTSGGHANGDAEGSQSSGKKKDRSRKRAKADGSGSAFFTDVDTDSIVKGILSSSTLMPINALQSADGNEESARYVRLVFDILRRRISQLEDLKDATGSGARRPDLRAGSVLLAKGIRTNSKKRVGAIPGVNVGDIFYFRMEMCLVGLHAPSMAGIDYMTIKLNKEEEPVAVSVVSSGGYEDDTDDPDVLVYSGQGGNIQMGKDVTDQKLVRGNLALEKSLHRGNEIRVIRGVKDPANPQTKVYFYDGLYTIQESWAEKGKSGCTVYKYKFVRIPGQPEAFMTWKFVLQWRSGTVPRDGVILPDLTSGAEKIPVCLVNEVDNEKGPGYFAYIQALNYSAPVGALQPPSSCNCKTGCAAGEAQCQCAGKNGGYIPYISNGVLVDRRALIYECSPSCICPATCRNRASQGGLKLRLEVFRTKDRGWGLRSWESIRGGTFICEYAGEVISGRTGLVDDYIFDSTRTFQPPEVSLGEPDDDPKLPFPLVINAKNSGNVARFINHSCAPNLFWQPIVRYTNSTPSLHIGLFAVSHIPPMTELTFDYGIVPTNNAQRKGCLCGSPKCRGFFF